MATINYKLEEINKATDVLSPDPINRNMAKIDTQMKANADEIKRVSEIAGSVDVTANVEEVVNRRVNSDRTKPLNTIISEIKDVIIAAINTARDNIKSHVTSEHTNTKNSANSSIVSARDSVNANIDAEHVSTRKAVTDARDSVKQHVSNERAAIVNAVNAKNISVVKKIQRGRVGNTGSEHISTPYRDIQISPVDINKAFVITQPSYKERFVEAQLVNSTTLRQYSFYSVVTSGDNKKYSFEGFTWEIVELN